MASEDEDEFIFEQNESHDDTTKNTRSISIIIDDKEINLSFTVIIKKLFNQYICHNFKIIIKSGNQTSILINSNGTANVKNFSV